MALLATIKGVRIRGVCAVVPENISRFEDEMKHFPFPEKSSRKLARMLGLREHRIAQPGVTHVDLAAFVMKHLFQHGLLNKSDVKSLLFVSEVMEHPIPGNSKVLHGALELSKSTYCGDIYENCPGFLSGLFIASNLIAASATDEVVLVTAISGMSRANMRDRSFYPLGGDAAAVTVVARSDDPDDTLHFSFRNDGTRLQSIITPAGGQRLPRSVETGIMAKDEAGNVRSLNDPHMDGTAVFQFVIEEAPLLYKEICRYAGVSEAEIDFYLTHQPNRFILEKLADRLGVPRQRLFNNIVENFGNSACSSIPVNIAFNLGETLLAESYNVCFLAFGAGLTQAAALARLGRLDFCRLIEYPSDGK